MRRFGLLLASLVAAASFAIPGTPTGATTTTTTTTPPPPPPVPAYWLVASDGGIFSFGGAQYYGSTGNIVLNKPIVGIAASHDGAGYWMVASDGGIFSFGDAQFQGSTGNITLNKPVVGMAATNDGAGYWLVASDGGIFSFGDAQFHGSTGNIKLNQPIVGMAATPDGGGYWLVASDGGIFSFGDAQFYGSTGNITLNKPIIAMIAGPASAPGYSLIASDGGIFSFGQTPFYGSLGGIPLKRPIAAAAATPTGNGYWFSDTGGLISPFGKASYYGSAPSPLNKPIVGMADAPGNGAFVGASYPSGSYGFDISNYQCTSFPTGDHAISIVQVDGGVNPNASPPDYPNQCLTKEAAWAGGGLNLYTFLGNSVSGSGALCTNTTDCYQVGYDAGINAFNDAQPSIGNSVTTVGWWLDVEGAGTYWTSSTADNAATVMGAIAALHNTEGIADVGVYASPDVWNTIVGNYQPAVPYWMADWLSPRSGPASCADVANQESAPGHMLPTGPVEIVQYDSQQYDEDYAC